MIDQGLKDRLKRIAPEFRSEFDEILQMIMDTIPLGTSAQNPLVAEDNTRIPTADQTAAIPAGASAANKLALASEFVDGANHGTSIVVPTGLWQGDGALTDGGGNSYDYTVAAGTEKYGASPVVRGKRCFFFDGATRLEQSDAVWRTANAISVAFVCMLEKHRDGANRNIVGVISTAGTSGDNADSWQVAFGQVGGGPSEGSLLYYAQTAAGVDIVHDTGIVPLLGVPFHLTWTRSADGTRSRFYLNGGLVSEAAGLAASGAGINGVLQMGGTGLGAQITGIIQTLLIEVGAEWDAATVAALARQPFPTIP